MNDSASTHTEFVFRRLSEGPTLFGYELHPAWWVVGLALALILGFAYIVVMYVIDSRSVRPLWSIFLGGLRCTAWTLLAVVFLLPSCQQWEKAEKSSRVVILLDVSDSITRISDDIPSASRPNEKLETRLDKILRFLDDKEVDFLGRLMAKNPVVVYRFGSRLDEESQAFAKDQQVPWSRDDWTAWVRLDTKRWLLQGLSEAGQKTLREHPEFAGDKPGDANWALLWVKKDEAETVPAATPETGFSEADRKKLLDNRGKLEKRLEVMRQLLQGTNVPESLMSCINREANNMVQGVVVISDGRSTQGSESAMYELRSRAKREGIPVFCIGIGEDRLPISITITDVQTPLEAPPDERFNIGVEVDGAGLPGKEKPVYVDVFRPGDNPKKDKPIHTLTGAVTFQPGEPPHGRVEFGIDPAAIEAKDKLPAEMFKPVKKPDPNEKKDPAKPGDQKDAGQFSSGKPELLEGEWKFVVRVPKDDGEAFAGKEHTFDPVSVQVVKKAMRVLLFAGGPTHEFQFLRQILVREVDEKRAELSIFLQNMGRDGRDVQDVPPERRLGRFPTTLIVGDHAGVDPKQKYYNLDEYDVIIAVDPDWNELELGQFQILKTWIERQAGGLIIVAGPINTFQLARADETSKLKALQELFPVVPGDSVLPVNANQNFRRNTKKPWYLNFPGANKDLEFLKLDDDKDSPLSGWDEFFFRKEHRDERDTEAKRGFYEVYPVQAVKKGATVVATFADPAAKMPDGSEHPFLVTMDYPQGRIVYIGSGELRRLRGFRELYYERFWIKLARYASAGTRLRQNKRGVLVMGRQFSAGNFVRLEAQLFGPDSNPLPEKSTVTAVMSPINSDDAKDKKEIKLMAKQSSAVWGGWFQGRHLVETPGEYKIEVPIPGTPDVLRGKFIVRESNPELDMVRPDFAALYQMAGEFDEVAKRLEKPEQDQLRSALLGKRIKVDKREGDKAAEDEKKDEKSASDSLRLFFDLKSAEIIPDCMRHETKTAQNKGKSEDLWDRGIKLGNDNRGSPIVLPWMLLALVGLLSAEWLTRKLLRLA
ncbi:MAG: hypothetical protein ACJ8F7_18945 [Gemmataceae bacterium]